MKLSIGWMSESLIRLKEESYRCGHEASAKPDSRAAGKFACAQCDLDAGWPGPESHLISWIFHSAGSIAGSGRIWNLRWRGHHRPGQTLQQSSHRESLEGRAFACIGRRWRHSGVRLRAKLRRSLPQEHSADQHHLRYKPRRSPPEGQGLPAQLTAVLALRKRWSPSQKIQRWR